MSQKLDTSPAVIGSDIGKNSFHIVGQNQRSAIVLRQKSWIEAAKKRLHHNVLAIALANKPARIAWAVLHKGCTFECVKSNEDASQPA